MKGLIALDLDGTVTGELHTVDPQMVEGLRKLSEEGWQIAFITGRIFSYAWHILENFTFPYLLAVQNGADILQMPEKKLLRRNYLKSSLVSDIDGIYDGFKEDFIVYAGIDKGDFCYYRTDRFSPKLLEYLEILKTTSAGTWQKSDFHFDGSDSFPLIKCLGGEKDMQELNHQLKLLRSVEVSCIRDPIDKSLFLNLVTDREANKGKAVHFFRESCDYPKVIVAGDDRNDIPMLKEADVAIVIEKAPADVLQLADITAKPPGELGLLSALDKAIML